MNNQREIVEATELLTPTGDLLSPGYAKHNLFIYNREAIAKRLRWRLKEWDFYQTSDGKYMVQLNLANISIGAAATVAVVDLTTGKKKSGMGLKLFPKESDRLPLVSDKPNTLSFKSGGVELEFDVTATERRLYYKDSKLEIDLVAHSAENAESITIATPFKKKGRFFYTNKINCMPTSGSVKWKGAPLYTFSAEDSYTVLDWGRGVWPYSNYWYWANGTTRLDDGKLFGFELTWGIGDESNATETMLFYDGKGHKIGAVDVETKPDGRWMQPWHFVSEDGRLDLTMTPTYDNYNPLNFGLIKFSGHQVHGLWNGSVTLDDGRVLKIDNMYAFCEKIYNRW